MVTKVIQEVSEADIQQAFSDNGFEMVYQPQVNLANQQEIIGAEAFVRLNHPQYGMLTPASFLPLVKEMGLMLDLTRYVVDSVARTWSEWNEMGSDISISVNIDESTLREAKLGKELGKVLSEHEVPKQRITLEFGNSCTESEIETDIGKKLLGLRMKGYRISVDDYGRAELKDTVVANLPLDEIKLDRRIIGELLSIEEHKRTCKKAFHLANSYGLRIVAVGVEDQAAIDWLARMGCDAGQGYYIGKPLSQNDFFKQLIKSGKLTVADETKTSILLIEDDVQYQDLLCQSLGDAYNIRVAGTITEAKQRYEAQIPNIIISDVNLPDGNGIEFCQDTVDITENNSPNIIFISGGQDFDNKLQAYEAGGNDFIQKPFSITELVAKVKQLSNYQSRRQDLIDSAQEASQMVMQSLKETAIYGDIVQFLKNIMSAQDEEQIARELFNYMGPKGLYTCIEFRDGDALTHFDQVSGACSPMQLNIFELLRDKGRLYPFGQRMLVNDYHVSFMVKNMPTDEAEEGKVRDYIAVLIEGMESRYKELLRQRVLNNVTQKLESMATKLLSIVGSGQESKNALIEKYSFELQMSFHTLDLTDDQETQINAIIDKMLKGKEEQEEQTEEISEEVNNLLSSMKSSLSAIDKQVKVVDDDATNNTVELF
jgi:EAL domain-containing protein (putative c-di-GMP-specific phosphodiesterase class I)/DNA-binding response OmpR family regulator/ribosomal protein S13